MVGHQLSDPAKLSKEIDRLCSIVLQLGTTKKSVRQLKAELQKIFQMAIDLSRAFETTPSATFTVSYPRVASNRLQFNTVIMDDKGNGGGDGLRQVGMLIFPGVFKVTSVRTCMVKVKVVCTDDIQRHLGRSQS